jgi:hypothetical protein
MPDNLSLVKIARGFSGGEARGVGFGCMSAAR